MCIIAGGQMSQDDPDLDQRLTRFEARLDRFSLALHQWQQSQEHGQPGHSDAVDQRLRTLEDTLDREAHALRRMHEEPLRQLQAQAANLKDICAAASNSVSGFDQVEARLAALQADVQTHLNELTRTLQTFVTELRIGASSAVSTQTPAAAWPLDRVVHLHDELRRGANEDASGGPDTAPPRDGRVQLLERGIPDDHDPSAPAVESHWLRRRSWYLGGAAAAALLIFGLVRIESRLNDAGARAAAAEHQAEVVTQQATREAAVARQEANRQIAEARQSAQRAETIGAILTAPDLIRYNLTSIDAVDRSSAQLLWSRTRGIVLSASRLPSAPPEAIYQLWLRTTVESVSAGLFVPDATGQATLVADFPKVMGPVVGAQVTVEPSGGRSAPSGRTLLVRLPQG